MRGAKPKPTHLKLLAGNPGKRLLNRNEPKPQGDLHDAPDWLTNAHAVKEWQRLAPILTANKLLTEAGLSALGQLCSLHGKVVQLYSAGEAPVASMVAQLRGLMNDFGLTPVAQGKVKAGGDETKAGNKFAGLAKPGAK